MTLLVDIYEGKGKERKKIAGVGDKVALIADHDNVLIVEYKGIKFSVRTENVKK